MTAANVIINGDYEGDVDCGGRFEIGSTGRVKGKVKAQVLVVKEGAHFEGARDDDPGGSRLLECPSPASASAPSQAAGSRAQPARRPSRGRPGQHLQQGARGSAAAAERAAAGPGTSGNS